MPVIKRYSNRKLYDSDKRTYVTLEDIADMIRMGAEVEVVDHDSGQDITAATLAQIIYEQEKKSGGMLPHHMFARLIRSGGSRMQSFQESFFAFLDPLLYAEEEIRRRLDWLVEAGKLTAEESSRLIELLLSPDLVPFSETDRAMDIQLSEDLIRKDELNGLLQRIESLEKELDELHGSYKAGT